MNFRFHILGLKRTLHNAFHIGERAEFAIYRVGFRQHKPGNGTDALIG